MNDVRKLTIALVVTAMLLAAAAAAAPELPRAGVQFTGPTSAKKVNGFGDTVTFLTGAKSLRRFSFGSLGCFGYGSFPVGVDPYATSLAQLKTVVPFTPAGTFAIASTVPRWSGGDESTSLLVSIAGRFKSATAATGTITITEKGPNGGSCGPQKMTFTAIPGHD